MKYIKNITGGEKFPLKQILAYKEKGKGNVGDKIKKNPEIAKIYGEFYKATPLKYKDYVLIEPGEKIETNLNGENISNELRLEGIDDKKPKKEE